MEALAGFISYSTSDKRVAADVRSALFDLGVDCFLAHDDLRVSEEWKRRILEELRKCKVFVALLSKSFKTSEWAPQEAGFAVARRGTLIIPISLDGTLPFGFISDLQAPTLPFDVSSEFFVPALARKFPRHTILRLIENLSHATSYRGAEALMRPLLPLFDRFVEAEIEHFIEACLGNGEIWDASLCRSQYIPNFIKLQESRIAPARLKALRDQIEYDA